MRNCSQGIRYVRRRGKVAEQFGLALKWMMLRKTGCSFRPFSRLAAHCALDFAREYEEARAAEHDKDESAAIVPSRRTMRDSDASLRGNMVDLTARDTDVR
jgi:hypothetical protein